MKEKDKDKDAFYFSHDCNARHDPKILALRSVYGLEGYGRYWIIIEMLREQSDYRIMLTKYVWNALAMQLQCSASDAEEFVQNCIDEFQLFQSDENSFWSESLLRRMNKKDAKTDQARNAANTRWNKGKQDFNNADSCDDNADAMQQQCGSNAIKEKKEKKEKENKENKSTNHAREGEPVDNFSPDDLLEGITLSEGSVRNDPDTDVHGEVSADDERDPDFMRFWSVYPKHGSESIAIEAWNTLLSQGVESKHLILAANKYAAKVRMDKVEDRFIKHAHNFLLQGNYRDYLPLKITHCPSCKEYHRCKGQEWYWVDVDDGRGGVKQETVVCPYKAGVLNEPA